MHLIFLSDNPNDLISLLLTDNIFFGVIFLYVVLNLVQIVSRALSLICCPIMYLIKQLKPSDSITSSVFSIYFINIFNWLSVDIKYLTLSLFKVYLTAFIKTSHVN